MVRIFLFAYHEFFKNSWLTLYIATKILLHCLFLDNSKLLNLLFYQANKIGKNLHLNYSNFER